MKSLRKTLERGFALFAAVLFIWTAPGLGVYQALAAVIAPVRVGVPMGGAAGASGAAIGAMHYPHARFPGGPIRLTPSLPGIGSFGLLNAGPPLSLPPSSIPSARPSHTHSAAATSRAVPTPAGRIPIGGGPETGSLFLPGRIKSKGGRFLPDEIPESLRAVRGRPNRLGRRFKELGAAFAEKRDTAVEARSGRPGTVRGYGDSVLTQGTGLTPRSNFGSSVPASAAAAARLSAPERLTLRTPGLKVSIEKAALAGAGAAGRAVWRQTGLTHIGDFDGLSSAQEAGFQAPREAESFAAAAASEKRPSGGKKVWLGIGKVAVLLIGSLVIAQIGVEALGVAMPALVQKTFGDFTAVAQLAIFASIASIIGRQLAAPVIRKLGLKKTYLGANGVRLVSISLLAGLLATGHMTLPLMMLFYSINGLVAAISMTTLESIAPVLVGRSAARLEKFWTWQQTILETVGIIAPIVTGAVIASLGFLPALIAFPAAMFASLAIVFLTLKIPKRLEAIRRMELEGESELPKRGFFKGLTRGARLVWRNPALRYSFLAFTVYVMLNPFLYTMLAPAFGLRLMPTPELAASVQGFLTGLYSAGGLVGGLILIWQQWRDTRVKNKMRAEAESRRGKISDEDWTKEIAPWERERLRKSMLRWMLLGIAGLSAIATFALPLPPLSAVAALPSWLAWLGNMTLPAAALLPFGVAQVISMLKLRSFFQSRVPKSDEAGREVNNMPDAMGFLGSVAMLVSTLGLLGLKFLFQNVEGFTPFAYLAWAMIPLGALYFFLRWRLAKNSTVG